MEEESQAPQEVSQEVSQEDLQAFKAAKNKTTLLTAKAEKAILEARVAELEEKNIVLQLYLKYKLESSDSVDEITGKITKKEESDA